MNNLEKKVLAFLQANPYQTFKAKEIARNLEIPKDKYQKLRRALRALQQKGEILRFKKNYYGVGRKVAEVVGKLRVNSQGYGFVTREDGDDVFVSQKNMGLAMHGDVVRVRLFATSEGKSPEGQIVEVIERSRTRLVGTFRQGRKHCYVIPDEIKIHQDIIIPPDETAGALDGQKVVAEIDLWEHDHLNPIGHISQVLGFPDEPGVDILSIIYDFGLPHDFPEHVINATKKITGEIKKEEIQRRLDLRKIITFTIDPDDAKDFDDAISLERMHNGNFRLGVHIADVSYYVLENRAIDREAQERGTSVYLVDRVVPMLPEKISNEVCSLQEGKDKLCYSVLLEMTPQAEVVSYDIRETVIRSRKRFTYQEAQDILDGKLKSDFVFILKKMHRLSKKLIARRRRRGSIDFDSLEVKVILDDKGLPVDIVKRERLATNQMIEEFMLLANETVARHVGLKMASKPDQAPPFVYRVHEKPDAQSVTDLLHLARAFGLELPPPKRITPKYFQHLADIFLAHPASTVLQDALLRTMMKAKYDTKNIGHFGLAYKYYTHFTSPIRRYPDLVVHRLLKKYLKGGLSEKEMPGEEALSEICQKATDREIKAQDAERATIKLKQVEYMERHLGDVFEGFISRIVPFGIFVHIPEKLVDGLVHVSNLLDDYYVYNEENYSLYGQYSGKVYKLGDKVRVQVSRVSRNERLIDFVLAEK